MIDLLFILPLLLVFLSLSKNNLSLTYAIISLLFYLCIMLLYFHLVKYGGEFQTTFPDESTYIHGTSSLLFSQFVSSLFDTVGPVVFRVMNLLAYNLSVIAVLNRLNNRDAINWFLVAILALGNYWCFFILKEGLTVCGLVFIILYLIEKKWIYFILGVGVLILARPDALLLIYMANILHKVYEVSRIKFYLLIIFGVCGFVFFFSLPISQPIKLSFISRRLEDVYKTYDPETIAASYLSGLRFITSQIYIDTIGINFKRAFSYFSNSFGLASLLVSINFVGLVVFLINIKKRKYRRVNLFFLMSNMALILSHNTYRYANAIIIPYLLFFALERENESTNNESQ